MTDHPTILERAFQLADSGEFVNASAVQDRLSKEGFEDIWCQLTVTSLHRQLNKRCAAARASRPAR